MTGILGKASFVFIALIIFSNNGFAQCVFGDCQNGYGQMSDESLTYTYTGEFQNGLPHGRGEKFIFPDGDVITGLWVKGAMVKPLPIDLDELERQSFEKYRKEFKESIPDPPRAAPIKEQLKHKKTGELLAALGDVYCFTGGNPDNRLNFSDRIKSLYYLEKAVEIYTECIETYPGCRPLLINRSMANGWLKRYDLVEADLLAHAASYPNEIDTLTALADLYVTRKQYHKAIGVYSRILAQHNQPNILYYIAKTYEDVGDFKNALEFYQRFYSFGVFEGKTSGGLWKINREKCEEKIAKLKMELKG